MGRELVKKVIPILTITVALLGLASRIMAIDPPVDPFQKAKALALAEGKPYEGKTGKIYMLVIKGWGAIMHSPGREDIMLMKGSARDYSGVGYNGKDGKYRVSRAIKGSKPEITIVDRSVAMDIANKYLREIEAARGSK